MPSLRACFDQHGCDRGKRHGYERVYEQLPQPARMLEIGIFHGGGIAAWLDYWPDVQIVGIDTFQRIPPQRVPILTHPRVQWIAAESRTVWLSGQFDLIIDDGNHTADAQLETFDNLHAYLAPGGAYFIEDVWPGRPGYHNLLDSLAGHEVTHHDLRGHPDSYLLEIRC